MLCCISLSLSYTLSLQIVNLTRAKHQKSVHFAIKICDSCVHLCSVCVCVDTSSSSVLRLPFGHCFSFDDFVVGWHCNHKTYCIALPVLFCSALFCSGLWWPFFVLLLCCYCRFVCTVTLSIQLKPEPWHKVDEEMVNLRCELNVPGPWRWCFCFCSLASCCFVSPCSTGPGWGP